MMDGFDAKEQQSSKNLFAGSAKAMHLYSSREGFGALPQPGEETEQQLDLFAEGRAVFYSYGSGEAHPCIVHREWELPRETARQVLEELERIFQKPLQAGFEPEAGEWSLVLVNETGREYRYSGALGTGSALLDAFSVHLRKELQMPQLYALDGRQAQNGPVKKILITGFDPFGGETINPALQAVRLVQPPEGVELVRLEVPTVFGTSAMLLAQTAEREKPDAILCVGQAGGRDAVTPERVAINLMDASIPDNAGRQPVDEPVVPGGENALFSTLPVKAMVQAVRDAGIPAKISNTAGTFVCNQLLYSALYLCEKRLPKTRAGFVHLPYLPSQAEKKPGMPSLTLEEMVRALQAIIECIAQD